MVFSCISNAARSKNVIVAHGPQSALKPRILNPKPQAFNTNSEATLNSCGASKFVKGVFAEMGDSHLGGLFCK